MRLFFIFLLFLSSQIVFSQSSKFNAVLKIKLSEKSMPGEKYTLLVQGDISKLKAFEKQKDYTINYSAGNIASISCDINSLSFLIDQKIVFYAELVKHSLQTLNDTMIYRNRIKAVKQGAAPLAQAYDGTGILMGIIDSGIDVAHNDFKDAQGNTRIKFLWDQKPTSGSTVPAPFNYGIEWTDGQINANQCTHNDMQFWGHGTHVSGIAAGNGLANGKHEGVASKSDIIMVSVDFAHQGPATADAVQYILSKATLLNKPCVINASLGDYYGSHDATDLEAKLIENMITNIPGRVLVAAAGNGGDEKFHVKTQITSNDTSFTWLTNNGTVLNYWFYGDTLQIKNLQISVGANRPDFSDLGRISFQNYNYGLTNVQHDTLKHNGNRIGIIHNASSINTYGVYELYLGVEMDTTGLLWRVETKGSGLHHAWNFDFVSNGLPTQSQFPKMANYLAPDSMYSMVSSFQCSDEIITVANYINLNTYFDVNDTLRNTGEVAGSLAYSSSSGPTRDGRQKPDIAATGHNVFSALVTGMQASQISLSPKTVAQGSLHVIGGGTSASSPVVAGLAALYLQAHPTATNRQVKQAITQCAYADSFTTNNLPNYAWGYGKLDGKAAMVCGENLVSIKKNSGTEGLRYYPNPFKNKVHIELAEKTKGLISVYGVEGKLLFQDNFSGTNYDLDQTKLGRTDPGIYFVKISSEEQTYTFKLVKE